MPYSFSLDNKAIAMLGGISAGVMLLVFFTGFLIGIVFVPLSVGGSQNVSSPEAGVQPAVLTPARASSATTGNASNGASHSCSCNTEDAVKVERAVRDSEVELEPADDAPVPASLPPDDEWELPAEEFLVAEEAESPRPAAPVWPARDLYTLQVGAFGVKSNADRLAKNLRVLGYEPRVLDIAARRNRPLHAVRLGSYMGRQEAARAASAFSREQNLMAIVRRAGAR